MKWKIAINPDKSDALLIQTKRRSRPDQEITMNGHRIPWKKEVKYFQEALLRIQEENLCSKDGIIPLLRKKELIRSSSQVDVNTIHYFPDPDVVVNRMEEHTKSTGEIFQRQENISIRCAINKPWYVRNSVILWILGQTPTTEMMKIKARKAFTKLGDHQTWHLQELLGYNPRFLNRDKRPKK